MGVQLRTSEHCKEFMALKMCLGKCRNEVEEAVALRSLLVIKQRAKPSDVALLASSGLADVLEVLCEHPHQYVTAVPEVVSPFSPSRCVYMPKRASKLLGM